MNTEQKAREWLEAYDYFLASADEDAASAIITALLAEREALLGLVTEAPCYFAPQHDFEGRKLAWTLKANKAITLCEKVEPVETTGVEKTIEVT